MKYVDTAIVFDEVPDEITLAINISGCPCHCEGCHSSYLAKDIGEELTPHSLASLILRNHGITCVCFMGGDANPAYINELAESIRDAEIPIKTAWYSGRQAIPEAIFLYNFDYIKVGPYIKEKGPLTEPTTNQVFYRVVQTEVPSTVLVDETHRFWKKNENSSM